MEKGFEVRRNKSIIKILNWFEMENTGEWRAKKNNWKFEHGD